MIKVEIEGPLYREAVVIYKDDKRIIEFSYDESMEIEAALVQANIDIDEGRREYASKCQGC